MKRRFAAALLCAAIAAASAGFLGAQEEGLAAAGTARVIGIDEAISLALEHNLSLKSSKIALDTKARKNRYKWNEFVPTVQVGGSFVLDNEAASSTVLSPVDVSTALGKPAGSLYGVVPYDYKVSQTHLAGTVSAQIQIVMGLFEGLKAYSRDYEAGLLTLEKAKMQTERDVRKAYNQILLARENLRVKQEGLTLAQKQTEQARANYMAGRAPDLTWLQAQVSEANKRPDIEDAENSLRYAKAQFAFMLGLPYNTEYELDGGGGGFSFASLEMENLILDAVAKKPDILELRASLATVQAQRKAQMLSLMLPAINLSWNTQQVIVDPSKDWKDSNLQSSGSFTVALGLQLNSFVPQLKPWQGVKDIDNQISTLQVSLSQMTAAAEIEVYNTVLGLEKTRANIEAMRATVDLAQKSYNATLAAYRAGSQDLLETQNAEDQLSQARLGVLAQEASYKNSLLDLEYAIGVPFGTLSKSSQSQ